MKFRSLNHFKFVVTNDLFVVPADHNYLLARWMYIHEYYAEFYWQAAQALEKYLKVTLILNNQKSKSSHNISDLFEKHCQYFGKLSTSNLKKPPGLHPDRWQEENPTHFVSRVGMYGNPNGRYGLISWSRMKGDLFKLDQLVFELRRLTVGLDWIIGKDFPDSEHKLLYENSYRTVLKENRNFVPRPNINAQGSPINLAGATDKELLKNWNFSFSDDSQYLEKPIPRSFHDIPAAQNSRMFLLWCYLGELEKEQCFDPEFDEQMRWLLDNIFLPKPDKDKFEKKLNDLKKK